MRSCSCGSARSGVIISDRAYHTGDEVQDRKEVSREDRDEEDFQDKNKKIFASNKKRHAM